MRLVRWFIVAAALTVFVLAVFASAASSHLIFCGHWDKIYNSGRAKADYWYWSQNDGDHFHYYTHKTRVLLPNGNWSAWAAQHTYYRKCNAVV